MLEQVEKLDPNAKIADEKGRILKRFKYTMIQPEVDDKEMGDPILASPELIAKRKELGWKRAEAKIP